MSVIPSGLKSETAFVKTIMSTKYTLGIARFHNIQRVTKPSDLELRRELLIKCTCYYINKAISILGEGSHLLPGCLGLGGAAVVSNIHKVYNK